MIEDHEREAFWPAIPESTPIPWGLILAGTIALVGSFLAFAGAWNVAVFALGVMVG